MNSRLNLFIKCVFMFCPRATNEIYIFNMTTLSFWYSNVWSNQCRPPHLATEKQTSIVWCLCKGYRITICQTSAICLLTQTIHTRVIHIHTMHVLCLCRVSWSIYIYNYWDPFRYVYIVWTNIYLLLHNMWTNIYALYIKQKKSTKHQYSNSNQPISYMVIAHSVSTIVMDKFRQHQGPTFKFFYSGWSHQAAKRGGSFWQIGNELRRNKILLIGTIPTVLPLRYSVYLCWTWSVGLLLWIKKTFDIISKFSVKTDILLEMRCHCQCCKIVPHWLVAFAEGARISLRGSKTYFIAPLNPLTCQCVFGKSQVHTKTGMMIVEEPKKSIVAHAGVKDTPAQHVSHRKTGYEWICRILPPKAIEHLPGLNWRNARLNWRNATIGSSTLKWTSKSANISKYVCSSKPWNSHFNTHQHSPWVLQKSNLSELNFTI